MEQILLKAAPETPGSNPARPGLSRRALGTVIQGLLCALVLIVGSPNARGQGQGRPKMPGLNKPPAGPTEQAFSGKIESLNLKQHVLSVDALKGQSVEMFPIKNGVQISGADGKRLDFNALAPGTNVIIYYQLKGEQRKIKQIVVLSAEGIAKKKNRSPAS